MTIPAQLPGVPYASLPRAAGPTGALSLPPRLVVIHDTSNTASAAAEAHYAATRTDAQSGWTSAHFYVDTAGPLGSLPLNKQAWAAYSYANSHGWHIEMCGTNAGTTGAVPAVTVAHTAALVRTLCQLGGIPMVKLSPADVAAGKHGICGHWDITQGLNVGTHDDPGPKFDWAGFIAQVKSGGDDPMAQLDDGEVLALLQAADRINGMATKGLASYSVRLAKGSLTEPSKLEQVLKAGQAPASVQLTDAQLQTIVTGVTAQLGGKLDQIIARLTAAGNALDG